MNNKPTPETDAETMRDEYDHVDSDLGPFAPSDTVTAEFARKLERERDEAREKYGNLATEHMLVVNKLCEERDELLNEIKRLRIDAQREAENHDRMVKELEGLYDKLKS